MIDLRLVLACSQSQWHLMLPWSLGFKLPGQERSALRAQRWHLLVVLVANEMAVIASCELRALGCQSMLRC